MNAHTPVMLREVLTALAPRENGVYVDATYGAGGYSGAILEETYCTLYGFDRDPIAIQNAKARADAFAGRLHLIPEPFGNMREALLARNIDSVDGVVMDLGVSSMQLDEASRGFSFMRDGPLSMRMDGGKPDAADIVANADVKELAAIFKVYGEEKRAGAIARAIVSARETDAITTTLQLAAIAEKAAPRFGPRKIHPATRIFQALRIFVNDELGQLIAGLKIAEQILRPAGRLVVVTFHSLEDRIVKRFIANRTAGRQVGSRHAPMQDAPMPSFEKVLAKAMTPTEQEVERNPRARSAKMRAAARLPSPVPKFNDERLGLPSLDILANFKRSFAL